MSLSPGMTIGRYQIIEELGQGGMATVYRAFQTSLRREVALKVLRAGIADDAEFRDRFVREALSVAQLQHPHIVQVFDFEEIDGRYLLAMELLPGGSLRDRLLAHARAGTRLERNETARIVSEVADALAAAHELGIVHRDIKPSNVLLAQRDRAVVADFGIAKIIGGTSYTQTGMGIGTPEYMSPEQAENRQVDARSDLYSLAVMAYEMVTGRVPFSGDTPLAIALAQIRTPVPPPSTFDPGVGAATEAVLLRALDKDPDARHPTTFAFANELRATLAHDGPATSPTIVVGRAAAAQPRAAAVAPAAAVEGARAGFWLRFLCRCIDLLSAYCVGVLLAGLEHAGAISRELAAGAQGAASTLALVGPVTASKDVFGLRVATADGSSIRVGRGFGRLLVSVLALLPLGLGYLAVAFDREKQGWHDKIAGTYVVHGGVQTRRRVFNGSGLLLLVAFAAYALWGPSDFALNAGYLLPPVPTFAPSPRPVALRPEQIIMPLEEFPLQGYRVTADAQVSAQADNIEWRRLFTGPSGAVYQDVTIYVSVTEPNRTYRVSDQCVWGGTGVLPTNSSPYAAATIGDRSMQCRFLFADGARYFRQDVASRNVMVNVYVHGGSGVSDASLSGQAAALARQQIAILDRVAPP